MTHGNLSPPSPSVHHSHHPFLVLREGPSRTLHLRRDGQRQGESVSTLNDLFFQCSINLMYLFINPLPLSVANDSPPQGSSKSSLFGLRSKDARRTAKGILITTLDLADSALEGMPVYGPKAAVSTVLKAIRDVDVSASFHFTLRSTELRTTIPMSETENRAERRDPQRAHDSHYTPTQVDH